MRVVSGWLGGWVGVRVAGRGPWHPSSLAHDLLMPLYWSENLLFSFLL